MIFKLPIAHLFTMLIYTATGLFAGPTAPVESANCDVANITSSSATVRWCRSQSTVPYFILVESLYKTGDPVNRALQVKRCDTEIRLLGSSMPYTVTVKTEGQPLRKCSFTTTNARLSEPKDLKVDRNGYKVLKLKWSPPVETNGQAVEYLLNFKATGPNSQTFINERSKKTWYRMGNLTSWVTYNITVRAFYLAPNGSIVEGPEAFILLKTSISAPGPPAKLEAEVKSNTSVDLSWRTPDELNGNLDGYIVYLNDTIILYLPGGITTHRISDLKPLTFYSVKMEAYNKDQIQRFVSDPANVSFMTFKSVGAKVGFSELTVAILIVSLLWSSI